jgi:hypothetical protein
MIARLPKDLRKFLYKYFVFRPAIIYAFSCMDPLTGKREPWAYIGQSRQELIARYNQHMGLAGFKGKVAKAQPWSDLYPEIRIVWQGKCPDAFLDLIEEFNIKFHKPVYNYMHNLKNPRRVEMYAAVAQRRARDLGRRPLRTFG